MISLAAPEPVTMVAGYQSSHRQAKGRSRGESPSRGWGGSCKGEARRGCRGGDREKTFLSFWAFQIWFSDFPFEGVLVLSWMSLDVLYIYIYIYIYNYMSKLCLCVECCQQGACIWPLPLLFWFPQFSLIISGGCSCHPCARRMKTRHLDARKVECRPIRPCYARIRHVRIEKPGHQVSLTDWHEISHRIRDTISGGWFGTFDFSIYWE